MGIIVAIVSFIDPCSNYNELLNPIPLNMCFFFRLPLIRLTGRWISGDMLIENFSSGFDRVPKINYLVEPYGQSKSDLSF